MGNSEAQGAGTLERSTPGGKEGLGKLGAGAFGAGETGEVVRWVCGSATAAAAAGEGPGGRDEGHGLFSDPCYGFGCRKTRQEDYQSRSTRKLKPQQYLEHNESSSRPRRTKFLQVEHTLPL